MAKVFINNIDLINIANAIRTKNGKNVLYLPSDMADAIISLPMCDTTNATATESDIVSGKTAYVNNVQIIGNLNIQKCYISTNAPSSDLGEEQDLCFIIGGG